MSTVKVVNVQHPSASTAAVTLAADGSMTGAFPAPNRNLLYNGAMQVAQRGTSATGITSGGTIHTADRWKLYDTSLGTWTQTVEADGPTGSGFTKSLKVLCTTADASPAAGDLLYLVQQLEGQDLQRVAKGTASAQQLTLSFWVKSNVTGTYVVELRDYDNSRHIAATYTVNASATWEQKSVTFAADTTGAFDNDNAVSLAPHFWFAGGSDYTSGTLATSWATLANANRAVGQTNLAAATNNYWQITGVQLEVGPVATAFEFKSYGQELRECQRYYEKSYNMSVVPGTAYTAGLDGIQVGGPTANIDHAFWWRVTKRADPILTFYDAAGTSGAVSAFTGTWANGGAIAGSRSRENYGSIDTNIASSTIISFQYVANAEL